MRVRKRGLQVAQDTYRNKTGHTVTVQGVVHLAERFFWDYLAVELFTKETQGADIHYEFVSNDLEERPALSKLAKLTAKLLPDLVHQSEGVSLKDHWENTDLKMSEFLHLLGEDRVKKLNDVAEQQAEVFAELEKAPVYPIVQKFYKRFLVYTPYFGPFLTKLLKKTDPLPMSIVVDTRNDIAVNAALESENDVFCFWGAAHLPGIGYGLKEAGYKRIKRTWQTAVQL